MTARISFGVVLTVIASLVVTAATRAATLTGTLVEETWVQTTAPGSNFVGGIDGDGFIFGNEIGMQTRWVDDNGTVIARGGLVQFTLPTIAANEVVTGIRLTLHSTEGANPLQDMLVGWTSVADNPDLNTVTFNDMATGTDTVNFEIDWKPLVNFSAELGNSGTAAPLGPAVYSDLTAANGLAQFIAGTMDTVNTPNVTIVLAPTGDANNIALFHGSDPTPGGEEPDPQYFPKLEIFTEATAGLAGDLNDDGFVGQDDLNIVLGDWGNMPPGDLRADPSGDGFVGQDDLNPVLADWGQGTPPVSLAGSSLSAAAVPEPSSILLLAMAIPCGLTLYRRRRRRTA